MVYPLAHLPFRLPTPPHFGGGSAALLGSVLTGALWLLVSGPLAARLADIDQAAAAPTLPEFAAILALISLAATAGCALRREWRRRDRAEAAARDSALQLRLLTDHASDLLLHLDWQGRIRFVAPSCRAFLGRAPEEMLGRDWIDLVHPRDRWGLTAALAALREARPFTPKLTRLSHRSGEWRTMEGRAQALPQGAGAIVVLRDVTERLALEARLQQAQHMQNLGQLTAGVAHDFNNMLQAQLGCLETLLDELTAVPTQHRLATRALELGERGARLTNQLLSFSCQQRLLPQIFPAAGFLDDLAETLQEILGPSIQLECHVRRGTPRLFVDPEHLQTAVANLVLNARDAMPAGGTLRIEASRLRAGPARATSQIGMVCLSLRDNGIGMDAETLARACDPFFTTKGRHGTGLGLASVQGFASQSGGGLTLRSAQGQGTTATLLLPAAPLEPDTPRNPTQSDPKSSDPNASDQKQIRLPIS